MLTQQYLKSVLNYNPDTGVFTWLVNRSSNARVGDIAGHKSSIGYITIRINRKNYYAHILSHLYMDGEFPLNGVDHINGKKADNSWANLREATHSQNGFNSTVRNDNTSGFKGVYFHKKAKKWMAGAQINGKQIYLGLFLTIEEASKAYQKFAKANHGEFYRIPA